MRRRLQDTLLALGSIFISFSLCKKKQQGNSPVTAPSSLFYKGKLMRWRAKRAEFFFRLFTGRESAAGENFGDFRAISEVEMVKKGTLEAYWSSDFL